MKIGFPGGPRLEWHDRNPITRSYFWYTTEVAPHALTERLTYTVPAGKKALVSLIYAQLHRTAVATALADAYIRASKSAVAFMWLTLRKNVVGDEVHQAFSPQVLLLAGETISMDTYDGCTGGTITYSLGILAIEFDA